MDAALFSNSEFDQEYEARVAAMLADIGNALDRPGATIGKEGAEVLRVLHSLKGLAAVYGDQQRVAVCHRLEDELAATITWRGFRDVFISNPL
ncbi:MAG: Hpt domain-containing protein [Pseudomonadota bacterium]